MKPIHPSKIDKAVEDFLTSFPFFSELSVDELEILGDHIDIYQVQPDEVLFHEGDDTDCVYFILDGGFDVLKETIRGQERGVDKVVIMTLSAGSSIGEVAIIANFPREVTVKARTQGHVVAFTKASFDLIAENHPRIGLKISTGLGRLFLRHVRKLPTLMADYALDEQ